MLQKTFLAVAISTTFAATLSAQTIVNTTTATNVGEFYHIDNSPKYKKVQDVFAIDRIEYTNENTIVHFRFECYSNQYSGATFYAPGETGSWVLKAGNDAIFPVQAVRNVQINGELKAANVLQAESYWTEWGTGDHTTYTCELYFNRLPNNIKMADLIEGIGYEKATDRFNCLNIKLKTWEVMEPIAVVEPVVAEEVVAENNATATDKNNNSALSNLAEISWTAYPNPAKDIVNIELSVAEAAVIEVFNLHGQQLQQIQTQDRITTLNVSEYPSGTYMVRVTIGDQVTTKQIVKQ